MRILRRAAAVLCLATSLAVLLPALATSLPAAAVLLAFVLVAAWRPTSAAMIAALCTPLATSVMIVLRQGGEWVEPVIAALAAGSAARWFVQARPLRLQRLAVPAAVLAVTVAASLVVQLLVVRSVLSKEVFAPALLDALRSYGTGAGGIAHPLHTAARLLEGIFLLALIADAIGHGAEAITILRCSAAGGALAALMNMSRLGESAARTGHPVAAFVQLARSLRFSFPYPDVNAAGSYFALVLLVAAGFAAKASGVALAGWAAATAGIAAALWITGSRAAALASLAALVLFALRMMRRRTAPYAIVTLVVMAAAVVRLFPNPILDRSAAGALNIRLEMARVSMRMLGTDPLFGIGIGQFYERSAGYIHDPAVKAVYVRENAHNNFLQIATELGVLGIASFAALIWMAGSAAVAGWRLLDVRLYGATLGLAAFLVTCLAGHPLLTSEVAAAFWIVLACVAASTRPPTATVEAGRAATYVAVAACALAVASVPWRVQRDLAGADLEHVGHGVSEWHRDGTGHLYRQMLREATLFVPREAAGIELPYRLAQPGAPVTLEFQFRGRTADRLVVQDDQWHIRRLVVPHDSSMPLYAPLTIKALEGDPATVWLGKITAIGAH